MRDAIAVAGINDHPSARLKRVRPRLGSAKGGPTVWST
jgi:hypothetical protein